MIRLDSSGPAIFRQRRLGKNLEPFSVAKFRTMHEGVTADAHRSHVEKMIADEDDRGTKPMQKLEEDARVTRSGSFLRRTSIDELPQLWNVLRGEMSLVGPRPPISVRGRPLSGRGIPPLRGAAGGDRAVAGEGPQPAAPSSR